jgi:Galactoside-binding lectin
MSVGGDLLAVTQADHRKVFPTVYPVTNDDYNDIIFQGFIPRRIVPGHVVLISGVVGGDSQGEFVIMFNEEGCKRQLVHFNPRFAEQSVVINTMHDNDK